MRDNGFGEITHKNIRRGGFPSVPDLIPSIEDYLRVTNANPPVTCYGLLDGPRPRNLVDNEDRWYSTSPYRGLTQNNLHLLGTRSPPARGNLFR